MPAQLSQFFARAAAMLALCACVLLAGIYPLHPRGPEGWGIFLLMAAPLTIGLDRMGRRALQSRFVECLGQAGRLCAGVLVIAGLAALMLPVWQWALPYMDTW
ncbi:MAG: hypothetical protein JWN73_829 [Betaproteobacteria bacterium]|nr:hypothetical protein [Betaproteobacteria bacterium]